MKILAVDDDEFILDLLYATLSEIGFNDVTLATSAKNALQLIEDAPTAFDCLLLDIQMPEMDGIELCSQIRRTPGYRKTPVLMITAMSDKSNIDRAFAAGASDYVTKPFDVLELGTRVKLAQRLCDENRVSTDSIFAVKALEKKLNKTRNPDLRAPVAIYDVPGVINFIALENYVLQLSRSGLFGSSVFSFQIAPIEHIHSNVSNQEFQEILTDIADAIVENLRMTEFLMAYAGNGAFVCISHGRGLLATEDMEIAVAQSIQRMELIFDNGEPLDVEVHIGEPVRLGLRSGRSAVNELLTAITRAEQRTLNKKTAAATGRPSHGLRLLQSFTAS